MNNEERFRQSFNDIETYLRRLLNYDKHVSFRDLVKEATKRDKVVRRFEVDLLNYGELRNAIVHSNTKKFLAEPFEETVNNLEMIWKQIQNPPKLDKFLSNNLLTCEVNNHVNDVLQKMKKRIFHKFLYTKIIN